MTLSFIVTGGVYYYEYSQPERKETINDFFRKIGHAFKDTSKVVFDKTKSVFKDAKEEPKAPKSQSNEPSSFSESKTKYSESHFYGGQPISVAYPNSINILVQEFSK